MVIGVHAPEFAFEKSIDNVTKAVADLKITYPVAIDNDFAIWRAFQNEYWPALYFVDAKGHLRHSHFGEGDYDVSERIIQQLLAEAGASAPSGLVAVNGAGAEAAADAKDMQSPETYLGYDRAANSSPRLAARFRTRRNTGLCGSGQFGAEWMGAFGQVDYRFG